MVVFLLFVKRIAMARVYCGTVVIFLMVVWMVVAGTDVELQPTALKRCKKTMLWIKTRKGLFSL